VRSLPARQNVLRAIARRPHRYRFFRLLTMGLTVSLLFAVPLLGIARFDLFAGQHRALGRAANALYGLVAVAVAIFSFYFVTFTVNLVGGRMFCGWGCPVGELNRLADDFSAARSGRSRVLWGAALVGLSLWLTLGVALWWTSPGVFLSGPAALVAGAVVALGAGAAVAFARIIGWSFCQKACPIGLYYSVVQQKRAIGIVFDRDACLDEAVCVRACPVMLDPRDLSAPRFGIGGWAIEGLAANNHCLRCGACVEACELTTRKRGRVALAFGTPAAEPAIEELVQLPLRRTAAAVPRASEQAQVAASGAASEVTPAWRELLLTGGAEGLWGSGLAILSLTVAILVEGLVFLFVGGPLWALATGASVMGRLCLALLSSPGLAVVALLVHRRPLDRWLHASGLVLTGALVLISGLFPLLSPGSASRYRPKQTWTANAASGAAGPRSVSSLSYAPAGTPGFEAGTVLVRVTREGRPFDGALVAVDHPGPGLPLSAPSSPSFPGAEPARIGLGADLRPIYLAPAGTALHLEGDAGALHTLALSQRGVGVRNIPIPAGNAGRTVAAPPPGDYQIQCSNHPREQARLVVADHPYVGWTPAGGELRLERVPVGKVGLLVWTAGEAEPRRLSVTVSSGGTARAEVELSKSNSSNSSNSSNKEE
jgi:ferredoxin